ncbi:hypothetical protein HJG60_011660 [Phyllostomus discolor]|uniref:Uncharacterized protein n=1 Tax=Phyllostomus discolor TaxID=89673 RepID=A0A833ZW88_9CHIR|nr:hypothetical protein HJG60_011660 [Phyllostomus discolor]
MVTIVEYSVPLNESATGTHPFRSSHGIGVYALRLCYEQFCRKHPSTRLLLHKPRVLIEIRMWQWSRWVRARDRLSFTQEGWGPLLYTVSHSPLLSSPLPSSPLPSSPLLSPPLLSSPLLPTPLRGRYAPSVVRWALQVTLL